MAAGTLRDTEVRGRHRPWAWGSITALGLCAGSLVAAGTEESCGADLTCEATRPAFVVRPPIWQPPDLGARVFRPQAEAVPMSGQGSMSTPQTWQEPTTGMRFVRIPGGCYESPEGAGAEPPVCLQPFDLGVYEVTFDDYDRFARETARELPDDMGWGRGQRPVINVNVYDATNFARWLGRPSGQRFRLPTEMEWEHAARAGARTPYPWGDEVGSNRANCDGCGSPWDGVSTAPVGSFAPNAWGLYDMAGNVAEWTCSIRAPNPETWSAQVCDGRYDSRRRVLRNGAWSDSPSRLVAGWRDWNAAVRRTEEMGFRLVRELGPGDLAAGSGVEPKVTRR